MRTDNTKEQMSLKNNKKKQTRDRHIQPTRKAAQLGMNGAPDVEATKPARVPLITDLMSQLSRRKRVMIRAIKAAAAAVRVVFWTMRPMILAFPVKVVTEPALNPYHPIHKKNNPIEKNNDCKDRDFGPSQLGLNLKLIRRKKIR